MAGEWELLFRSIASGAARSRAPSCARSRSEWARAGRGRASPRKSHCGPAGAADEFINLIELCRRRPPPRLRPGRCANKGRPGSMVVAQLPARAGRADFRPARASSRRRNPVDRRKGGARRARSN